MTKILAQESFYDQLLYYSMFGTSLFTEVTDPVHPLKRVDPLLSC